MDLRLRLGARRCLAGKDRGMTKAEKAHLKRIASLPCIVCGKQPVEVHHVRRYGAKRDNFQTVPLCPECHRGNTGIHGIGKKRFEREVMTQDELLRLTAERLKEAM